MFEVDVLAETYYRHFQMHICANHAGNYSDSALCSINIRGPLYREAQRHGNAFGLVALQ